jgi:hypothetical protein
MRFHRYYILDAFVFITQVVSDRAPVFADPRPVETIDTSYRGLFQGQPR